MALALNLLIVAICGAALWWSANLIVTGATRTARHLGISDLIVGLTVVAFGTSAPEFAVTILAAISGHGDISVSNVTGSNMINFGFVLGLVALIKDVNTTRSVVRRDGMILISATILLAIFLFNHKLNHWEGFVLFTGLIVYNIYIFIKDKSRNAGIERGSLKAIDIGKLILGIALVTVSSRFLVDSAVEIARIFNLSEWAIGQTIVAFGTSVPELATSLAAVIRGRHGMSVGNLVGSNLFNILGVLGVSSVIRTITINQSALINIYILIAFTILVVIAMHTGRRITRREGAVLIAINLAVWILSFAGIIS